MKKSLKKIFLYFSTLLWSIAVSNALPVVNQYIGDISGEYIYYEDKSFKNETVVGFLYYDERTYAARIYSAANASTSSLEKDITIYVNIDPSKPGFVMTGEKIEGTVEGNADLVNYLHDMFYELSKRRQSEDLTSTEIKITSDDFSQFGGAVKIKYNSLVPIFNIEEVCSADQKPILQLQTIGLLLDSSDSSFTSFKGLKNIPKNKKRVFKKDKHSEELEIKAGSQKISLDTQWQQSMQNLWLLGENAILSVNEMNIPSQIEAEQAFDILSRKYLQSTTHSYSIWQQSKLTREKNKLSIMNVFYQQDSGNVTRDFKFFTKNKNGNFSMLTFTVFDNVYQNNRSYFDSILKSYSVY